MIEDTKVWLPLTRGRYTLIDFDDLVKVQNYKWHLNSKRSPYAVRSTWAPRTKVYLHRFLLDEPNGVVDHINGDTLDNRRSNLRVVSQVENSTNRSRLSTRNTSGITGLSWDKRYKYWDTYARIDRKTIRLGCFKDKEKAIAARQAFEMNNPVLFPNASRRKDYDGLR